MIDYISHISKRIQNAMEDILGDREVYPIENANEKEFPIVPESYKREEL